LNSLLPALTLGFLDDLTLGGAQQSVAADVNHTIESDQRLGLHLNTAKREVIAWPDTVISDPLLQKFSFVAVMTLTFYAVLYFRPLHPQNTSVFGGCLVVGLGTWLC